MLTLGAYERCRRYIECHSSQLVNSGSREDRLKYPCITISRETGAGAGLVSQHLIAYLQKATSDKACEWTFFDKLLIHKVLEDHNLPNQLSSFLKEDKFNDLSSVVNELLGIHPSKWTLLHKTTETILQLARMGNVVLVGRAANVITAKLPNTFHVRLVAPLDFRITKIIERYSMTKKEAAEFINHEDISRANYVRSNFFKEIEDPNLYHIFINTGLMSFEEAAKNIANAVMLKYNGIFTTMQEELL